MRDEPKWFWCLTEILKSFSKHNSALLYILLTINVDWSVYSSNVRESSTWLNLNDNLIICSLHLPKIAFIHWFHVTESRAYHNFSNLTFPLYLYITLGDTPARFVTCQPPLACGLAVASSSSASLTNFFQNQNPTMGLDVRDQKQPRKMHMKRVLRGSDFGNYPKIYVSDPFQLDCI